MYVRQTGRQFSTRYKERKTAWRNHSTTSIFAQRNSKMSHPSCVYINNRCRYQSITQQYFCVIDWYLHLLFAQHLIEEAHSFGPMNKIMKIVHCHKKGAKVNTIEKFHIHTELAKKNHLNDPQTILPNSIFDTLIKIERPTLKPYNCPIPSPRLYKFPSTLTKGQGHLHET